MSQLTETVNDVLKHRESLEYKRCHAHLDKGSQIISIVVQMSEEEIKAFINEVERILGSDMPISEVTSGNQTNGMQ